MNSTGKASDKIEGNVLPDEATAAVIDRIAASYNLLGPAMLAALPEHTRMAQALAHALAHKRVAPEYEAMLSNILAWLYVSDKLGSDLADQVRQATTEAAAKQVISEHVKNEDGELIPAAFLSVALGTREGDAEQCVLVQQHFHEDDVCRNVISELTAEGIDQLIEAMRKARSALLSAAPTSARKH
jgi:hypothetical protein